MLACSYPTPLVGHKGPSRHRRSQQGGPTRGTLRADAKGRRQGRIYFYADMCYGAMMNVTALRGIRGMTQRDKEKIKFNNPRGPCAPLFLVAPAPFLLVALVPFLVALAPIFCLDK